jgi:CheY-like chemotaxis protein
MMHSIDERIEPTLRHPRAGLQMPELHGLEPPRRIVARWPDADKRPRIVTMTANAMQGNREECLAAGMEDYVTQPIRVDALVEALNQARPRDAR